MTETTGPCPCCGSTACAIERPYVRVEGHGLFADRSIAACPSCGLRFSEPMPSYDELDDYYGSGDYDHGSRPEAGVEGPWALATVRAHSQYRFVTKALGRTPGSWLDLGAGYGVLLDEVARRGAHTAATELTPVRSERLAQRGHTVWPSTAEATGRWDVISFSHVLEHVPDPLAFLKDAAGLLAPGGVLFCEVPNVSLTRPDPDEPHVLFFTPDSLVATFNAANLDVVRVGECGRRTGHGWDRLSRYTGQLKGSGRLPAALSRLDAMHHYGAGQGRIYLRCVGRPA